MKRSYTILVAIGLVCSGCAPNTYVRTKGDVSVTSEIGRPSFDASGVLVTARVVCKALIEEHWCPAGDPHCAAPPVVAKTEPVDCPKDAALGKISLHAPWGQDYAGLLIDDVLHIDIDWRAVKPEVMAELNVVPLRSNWLVQSTDGKPKVEYRIDLLDNELLDLLAAIAKATGHDYSEAPAGERAEVTVTVTSQPAANGKAHVVVAVTNHGPSPVYRVVTRLAGVPDTKPSKLPMARIELGGTQKAEADIPVGEDGSVTLLVVVTSSNAPPVTVKHELKPKPKADLVPPQLVCSSPVDKAAPGQRIPIECQIDNPNDGPLRGVTYQIWNGGTATTPPVDIGRIEPHAQHKLTGEVTVATDATDDLPLDITVTVGTPVIADHKLSIPIVQPHRLCNQGQLTMKDFQRKHKRLSDELTAKRITQNKFNDIVVELWSCVRQSQARLQAAPPASTP